MFIHYILPTFIFIIINNSTLNKIKMCRRFFAQKTVFLILFSKDSESSLVHNPKESCSKCHISHFFRESPFFFFFFLPTKFCCFRHNSPGLLHEKYLQLLAVLFFLDPFVRDMFLWYSFNFICVCQNNMDVSYIW